MTERPSDGVRSRLARMVPDNPLARRLSLQSGLYAVGSGVFLTGNAVFFTQVVGLSAAQVGVGISVAGVVGFLVSVPLGRVADRVGPRRTWVLAAVGEAAVYLGYPWVRGFAAFIAVVVALTLMEALGSAGRGAYTIDAFSRGERVRQLAFVRSALNIGFTVGALLGGVALGFGDLRVVMAVPAVAGVVLAVNAVLIARLPDVRHVDETGPVHVVAPGALRNKPFLAVAFLNGLLGVDQILLNVVVPLWLVERTDAPHALLAWLFGTNTVLVVLLQVRAARGSETVPGALRATGLAGLSILTACVLVMSSAWTDSWLTVGALFLGYVAVTAAELFHSAGGWGLISELSDQSRRAEYQGAWRLGGGLVRMAGPAAFTWLAVSWRPEGWLVIAGVALVGAGLLPVAARAAERSLAAGRAGGNRQAMTR